MKPELNESGPERDLQMSESPRDDKKHKDTSIAMEEVRRGVIGFTQFALPHVHDPNGMRDLKAGVEESLSVVGSTGGF